MEIYFQEGLAPLFMWGTATAVSSEKFEAFLRVTAIF